MKNLFIQSAVNQKGETFLEVGFEDGQFTSIPTEFNSFGQNISIDIIKKDFLKIQVAWNVGLQQVKEALNNQFQGERVFVNII